MVEVEKHWGNALEHEELPRTFHIHLPQNHIPIDSVEHEIRYNCDEQPQSEYNDGKVVRLLGAWNLAPLHLALSEILGCFCVVSNVKPEDHVEEHDRDCWYNVQHNRQDHIANINVISQLFVKFHVSEGWLFQWFWSAYVLGLKWQ